MSDIPSLVSEGRRLIEATDGKHRHCTVCLDAHAALRLLPLLLAVAEAAELAVQDLGNVLYNIETGERRAAEEQATEIRARLDAALRGEVK